MKARALSLSAFESQEPKFAIALADRPNGGGPRCPDRGNETEPIVPVLARVPVQYITRRQDNVHHFPACHEVHAGFPVRLASLRDLFAHVTEYWQATDTRLGGGVPWYLFRYCGQVLSCLGAECQSVFGVADPYLEGSTRS